MRGFFDEIKHVEGLKFENQTPVTFLNQYIYVVLNSGVSNKAAESMMRKLLESKDPDTIKHPHKQKAIKEVLQNYKTWFNDLKLTQIHILAENGDLQERALIYLDTLPMIGAATKYHLARNLGLDAAKPDRHLMKVALKFKYIKGMRQAQINTGIQSMCKDLSEATGDRIGVVDVVIWRACEQGIMRKTTSGTEET